MERSAPKKAIFGWLAFVILAVFIGGSVGTRTSPTRSTASASRPREQTMANHFPDKSGESVLIQSQTGTNNRSPEFNQVVNSVVTKLEATRHVRNVETPTPRQPGHAVG